MNPELMRRRRVELGLSQGQVGMSQSTYNRIEQGKQQPSDVQLWTIHDRLGNWHVVGAGIEAHILAWTADDAVREALEMFAWAVDVSKPIKFKVRKR